MFERLKWGRGTVLGMLSFLQKVLVGKRKGYSEGAKYQSSSLSVPASLSNEQKDKYGLISLT
jgi:hypothetical protein